MAGVNLACRGRHARNLRPHARLDLQAVIILLVAGTTPGISARMPASTFRL